MLNSAPRAERTSDLSAGKSRSAVGLFVSFGISAILLVFLFWGLDWEAFGREFRKLHLGYLLLAVGLMPVAFLVRAIRWKYLLPDPVPVRSLYDAVSVGMLGNMILPLRIGEFVRAWSLSRWERISFSAGFATVVTERVFDVLTLLAFVAVVFSSESSLPFLVVIGAKALGALALVIIVFMLLAYRYGNRFLGVLHRVISLALGSRFPKLVERVEGMAGEFVKGLKAIRTPRQLILIFVWSFVLWFLHGIIFAIALPALGDPGSLWLGMVLNLLVAFAVAAPSAPGFVGTFQVGCVIALEVIGGRSHEFALAYSVVLHTAQFLAIFLCGAISLHQRGMSLRALGAGRER